jgi:hypothetical protein
LVEDPSELLRDFLRDNVSSYEELEALLFLARNPAQDWAAAEVADALKASVHSMVEALEGLAARGQLVSMQERAGVAVYRYWPSDGSIEQRVVDLRQAYEDQRLSVMQMMSGNALDRVRRSAMQRLADAFRLETGKK